MTTNNNIVKRIQRVYDISYNVAQLITHIISANYNIGNDVQTIGI